MYLIRKDVILTIAKALSSDYQIYGPAVEPLSGQTFFDPVTDLGEINLEKMSAASGLDGPLRFREKVIDRAARARILQLELRDLGLEAHRGSAEGWNPIVDDP